MVDTNSFAMQALIVTEVFTSVTSSQDYPGIKIKEGDIIQFRKPFVKKILCNVRKIGEGVIYFNAVTGKQVFPLNQ